MSQSRILSQGEVFDRLKTAPGWEYVNDRIRKQFEFEDYPEAVDFLEKLTPVFQHYNHHPDVHILYNKIVFELQRFDAGGKVTDLDFVVAKEIEKQYGEFKSKPVSRIVASTD